MGAQEIPTYLLRQEAGRHCLKAIPERLVIRKEEVAWGWGRGTFFSFWLGGQPKTLFFPLNHMDTGKI